MAAAREYVSETEYGPGYESEYEPESEYESANDSSPEEDYTGHVISGSSSGRRRRRGRKKAERRRIRHRDFGTWEIVLIYPRLRNIHVWLARRWNTLLMLTWLPLMIAGLKILAEGSWYRGEVDAQISSVLAGAVIGGAMHELSRAAAAVALGARVEEIGLLTRDYIPGFFCRIDASRVRHFLKQVQIQAAGVECNLALGGLCLVLMHLGILSADNWAYVMLVSLLLGLTDASVIYGSAGGEILGLILGENSVEMAVSLYFCPNRKRKLRRQGLAGRLTIAVSDVLVILQLTVPLLMLTEALFVLWYIWLLISQTL